jgi:hypothetical protein
MSWNAIAVDDVQNEILPDEVTMLNTIEGGNSVLPVILAVWVSKLRSMIEVGGNNLDVAGTIPDQLRPEAIAIIRWRWFTSLPKTDLCSEHRKAQCDDAMKAFNDVEAGKKKVEFPAAISGGPAGQMQVASGGRSHQMRGAQGAL